MGNGLVENSQKRNRKHGKLHKSALSNNQIPKLIAYIILIYCRLCCTRIKQRNRPALGYFTVMRYIVMYIEYQDGWDNISIHNINILI